MKLNLSKIKSKGFTLVEILLVVGFIALASVGVYTIYSKVQTANSANAESRNLDTIRAGIKNLYGASPNYAGLTPAVANNAKITPEAMRATATTIVNTFGGTVGIAPTNLGTGTNNGFRITYPLVTDDVCTKLVTTGGAQFDQVTVGATVVKAFGTNVINPATVTTACIAAAQATVLFDSL
ncbi:MAG: type 4 pilus major pilin [Rickettsiales bacterium]|nr:type 4 pilus major pilin [Rickettsiales bacterium]